MALANRITAVIVLVLGLALAVNSTNYELMVEFGPGPGLWPAWLGVAWMILAVSWFLQSAKLPKDQPFLRSPVDTWRVVICVAIFLGYLLLLDRVGFVVSTVVYLMVVLWLFERRGILNSAVISVVIPVGLSLLFDTFLKVGLPGGPLIP